MLFVHRAPAAPLQAFIESLWYCDNEPVPFALQRVLPSGSAQLIVNLKEDQTRTYHTESGRCRVSTASGTVLAGISARYGIIDTAEQESVAGVSFKPGGTVAFFRLPAHEMCDEDIPLDLLWGRRRTAELRERLLGARGAKARLDLLEETMLQTRLERQLDRTIAFALQTFAGQRTVRIASVTDRIGLSPKRFIEKFKATVGMPPKQFCRLLRFQSALALAERDTHIDWTRIAVDCGYFDQPHFIHDFQSFAGITPTYYGSGRTEFRNHVNFLQSETAAAVR